jgi:MFS family permease
MEKRESHLRVLGSGQFRRLLGAEWSSLIGDFALVPVIPFAVYALGGSTAEVAAVFGAEYLALTLLVLFGGVAGDRLQRRSVMVVADLVRFAAQSAVAVFFLLGIAAVWQLIAAQLVLGIGSAFFRPALTGMVPQTVEGSGLQAANAARGIATAMASMVGPAIGGAILVLANPGWAFAVDAFTFLASAALLSGLRVSSLPEALDGEDEPSVLAGLAEGWMEFRRRTWLWAIVVGFGLLNALVFAPFYVLGPQVVNDAGTWSTVLVFTGFGAVGGGVLAMRWHPARPLLIATLAVALWIPLTVLLAVGAPLGAVAPTAALGGAALAVFSALWDTTLQGVPEAQLSRLSSYDWLGGMAMVPLGYVIAALAASTIGAKGGLLAGAVVLVLTTTSWMAVKSIRRLGAAEPRRRIALAAVGSGIGSTVVEDPRRS